MHHYKTAETSIENALAEAVENGWSEAEALQSLLVVAIAHYTRVAGVNDTKKLLAYELSNLRGTVDYDFVRSR
jgi:hypothetical protein